MFHVLGPDRVAYRFFQSKKEFDPRDPASRKQFVDSVMDAQKRYLIVHPFYGRDEFQISTPLGPNSEIPWNEIFASYVGFFYLGSLVRYHPRYMEDLLERKEAWTLEQFANNARLTLLRHFVMLILDKGYVFLST